MAIQCGFFNSVNKDRLYAAEDMTKPYELLISNGVFASPNGTPSDQLQVMANTGFTAIVKPGRGIFADKWLINDAEMTLTFDAPEVTVDRIDSVIVRIDVSENVRAGSIFVRKGTPSTSPVPPDLIDTGLIKEYRLANVRLDSDTLEIRQLNIQDCRGSAECPWVTSLINQVDTSTIFVQWTDAFRTWFDGIKEFLAKSTLIRSYTTTYTASTSGETTIPINLPQYNRFLDIIHVYINGMMLIEGVEYTKPDNNENVILTMGVDAGTPVSFIIYKSIDGTDAQTVVAQVSELEGLVNGLLNLDPTPLYASEGVFPDAGAVITPSKTLAKCQHGWELIFSFFNGTAATDTFIQSVRVPKKSHKGAAWNGESVVFPLAYTAAGQQCIKSFSVFSDRLVSADSNDKETARNVVLKAIYEY